MLKSKKHLALLMAGIFTMSMGLASPTTNANPATSSGGSIQSAHSTEQSMDGSNPKVHHFPRKGTSSSTVNVGGTKISKMFSLSMYFHDGGVPLVSTDNYGGEQQWFSDANVELAKHGIRIGNPMQDKSELFYGHQLEHKTSFIEDLNGTKLGGTKRIDYYYKDDHLYEFCITYQPDNKDELELVKREGMLILASLTGYGTGENESEVSWLILNALEKGKSEIMVGGKRYIAELSSGERFTAINTVKDSTKGVEPVKMLTVYAIDPNYQYGGSEEGKDLNLGNSGSPEISRQEQENHDKMFGIFKDGKNIQGASSR